MAIPTQTMIVEPLLIELLAKGGASRPSEIYSLVAKHFPEMDDDDLAAELKDGHNMFNNRVQWTRQALVDSGHIDRSIRGVWALTESGREAAKKARLKLDNEDSTFFEMGTPVSLVDLIERHESTIRNELMQKLVNVSAQRFEYIAAQLLRKLGFREIVVTQLSNDGGLDGHGRLKMGIVQIKAAFQCKRYQPTASVGRPEVNAFRGAAQGKYDQGIFITTGRFTKPAREESLRAGSIPILMIDGEAMLDLMIEHGIGVELKPLSISRVDDNFFIADADGD